ncbi:MAG: HEAT repeat domain-containing protein [Eubacteriales bacterium]
MGYYDLTTDARKKVFAEMEMHIREAYRSHEMDDMLQYFSDNDTYIRKNSALITGRLCREQEYRENIFACLNNLLKHENSKVRQTAVNCLGEIGKTDASVLDVLGTILSDPHHSVRNAVIGALKQMGEKNPAPTLAFARDHIHHPDSLVRREMVHGIELRGRMHPEEVLLILRELEFEEDKIVQAMVVHVIGQISYKKGCLEKVLGALEGFRNQELVKKAHAEIINTHKSYQKFAEKSPAEAEKLICERFGTGVLE